jgi:hypothetical protein
MQKESALSEALKSLKQAEAELLAKLKPIQEAIAAIEVPEINAKKKGTEYDEEWPPSTKFLFLLNKHKRFLHFREAAQMIAQIEGGDVAELTAKLSTGTGSIKASGQIVKFQASKSNIDTYWGSPKWLDKDGKIIAGHEFIPSLSDAKKSNPLFSDI